jgi:hypothetical protein
MTRVLSFFLFLLFFNSVCSQNAWDGEAGRFVSDAAKNRYKYTVPQIKTAIDASSSYINNYCKTCSPEVLSSLYLARANLRTFWLEYEQDSVGDGYTPPPAMVSKIKSDFLMAQSFCQTCKCGMFDNMLGFYGSYGSEKQLDSLEKVAKVIGKPTEHSYMGIHLNYIPQQSIAGIGFGFLNAGTVRQPKKWADESGKRYRKCKYEYPMSTGFLFFGYERSLMNAKYNAFKIDPVWLNYIFSIHPLQVVYADTPTGKELMYRPEFGFSFSTFAVNYALNLRVGGTSEFAVPHNISIRFCIPAIKIN